MRLPRTVKILSHTYKVGLKKLDKDVGETDFMGMAIYINRKLPKEMRAEVLQHEIFHVLDYHLDLGLKHKQLWQLSEGFAQVRKDNKI